MKAEICFLAVNQVETYNSRESGPEGVQYRDCTLLFLFGIQKVPVFLVFFFLLFLLVFGDV